MRIKLTLIVISTLIVAIICNSQIAAARVRFLPAAKDTGGLRANIYNACSDYKLSEPLCQGKPCAEGWICGKCTNKIGTSYKCDPKEPPLGYTAGLTVCEPCQTYSHLGYSGNLINGKCTPIENCIKKAESPEYASFKYISGIKFEEDKIIDIESTGYRKNTD